MTFNNFRDRLLLRMLSKRTRNDLWLVVLHDIQSEIDHFVERDWKPEDGEHIAPSLCHLADLMEEKPQWSAELAEALA